MGKHVWSSCEWVQVDGLYIYNSCCIHYSFIEPFERDYIHPLYILSVFGKLLACQIHVQNFNIHVSGVAHVEREPLLLQSYPYTKHQNTSKIKNPAFSTKPRLLTWTLRFCRF